MLVPTKIDLTVDAERHKTFKVPPFLQALEHSSDCERSSQRVEKKSSISSIKNTGKAQTPSPPNGHARFWVNDPGLDHLQKYFFDSFCFLEWT